jgi:hypothetical protein
MGGWIKDAADKMRGENARQRAVQEAIAAANRAKIANGPTALQKLSEAVEKDILEFNEVFSKTEQRLKPLERIGDNEFQVVRQYEPPYVLHVELHGASLNYSIQAKSKGTGGYGIYVDDHGNTQLADISFEEASKELISPALVGLEVE